jgi:hypothetical protein
MFPTGAAHPITTWESTIFPAGDSIRIGINPRLPERTPLLGYAEGDPQVVDWQIKWA